MLSAALLCALTLLAYSNSFQGGVVLDNVIMLMMPHIQAATWENVQFILQHTYWWPQDHSGLYRPFTSLTFLFNYAILGNNTSPEGYHLFNWAVHSMNVLIALALGRRILGDFRLALCTAAIWAVHPILTEDVTNIVGRSDLLAGTAILGGVLIYIKSTEAIGWRRLAWLGGLGLLALVGVFSKESGVMVVGAIGVYEIAWWQRGRSIRNLSRGGLAILPALLLLFYARHAVVSPHLTTFSYTDMPLTGADFWTARISAYAAMARYLGLIAWPRQLSFDYSYPQIPFATGTPQDWLCWGVSTAALSGLVLSYRRNRPAFFFGAMALVTFLPASNLLVAIGPTIGERLVYLPALGLVACFVLMLRWGARRLRLHSIVYAVTVVAVLGLGARTWVRNLDWADKVSFARAGVRVSPRSFRTHILLSEALAEPLTASYDMDEALREGERSVALLQSLPNALLPWQPFKETADYTIKKYEAIGAKQWDGSVGPQTGRDELRRRAIVLLRRELAIVALEPPVHEEKNTFRPLPLQSNAHNLLALLEFQEGHLEEAYSQAHQSRLLEPANMNTYVMEAKCLTSLKKTREAVLVLMEGAHITGDTGSEGLLVTLLMQLNPKGCSVMDAFGVLKPNPQCEEFHQLRCTAAGRAVGWASHYGLAGIEKDLRKKARIFSGCEVLPI